MWMADLIRLRWVQPKHKRMLGKLGSPKRLLISECDSSLSALNRSRQFHGLLEISERIIRLL